MTKPHEPDPNFDPKQHELVEHESFDEFEIGDTFRHPSRTMTSAIFGAFQLVSGDNHPIHYDREYCRERGHPEIMAHGYQTLAQLAPGAGLFPHVIGDALIGFLEQSCKFLKHVYLGDTLYPTLVVTDLKRQRTTGVITFRATIHNQHRELVLEGEQKFLVRL